MSTALKHFIEKCDVCRAFDRRQSKETFIPHETPDLPWEKVGVDLFNFKGRDYLISVDYYSSFWEIDVLESTRSDTVIHKLKSQFARHGIPETCMSDNGSQFSSDEFREFSRQWNFKHITSSPKYPQSNGKVEAAVKSAKTILKRSQKARTDPYLALLEYRNTPTQGMDTSPVMRLMSRRTRTRLPIIPPPSKALAKDKGGWHTNQITRSPSGCNTSVARDFTPQRASYGHPYQAIT